METNKEIEKVIDILDQTKKGYLIVWEQTKDNGLPIYGAMGYGNKESIYQMQKALQKHIAKHG